MLGLALGSVDAERSLPLRLHALHIIHEGGDVVLIQLGYRTKDHDGTRAGAIWYVSSLRRLHNALPCWQLILIRDEGLHIPACCFANSASQRSDDAILIQLVSGSHDVRCTVQGTRRCVRLLYLLGVEDVGVGIVAIQIGRHAVRKLPHPCHYHRVDVVLHRPLQPLVSIGLGNGQRSETATGMCFEVVTHAVTGQVARCEYVATRIQVHVTQSAPLRLEQTMQHVLDGVGTFGILVEHQDHRLAHRQLEPAIRCVVGNHPIAVHHRHGGVT